MKGRSFFGAQMQLIETLALIMGVDSSSGSVQCGVGTVLLLESLCFF